MATVLKDASYAYIVRLSLALPDDRRRVRNQILNRDPDRRSDRRNVDPFYINLIWKRNRYITRREDSEEKWAFGRKKVIQPRGRLYEIIGITFQKVV